MRSYLRWAANDRRIPADEVQTIHRVLDQFEMLVAAELDGLDERLRSLRDQPGVEVFPLGEEMLVRALQLSTEDLVLKPFDQAILAAVLVCAEQLRHGGADDVCFCEVDGDLQPWDKDARSKQPLTPLYDSAHLWVYGDFEGCPTAPSAAPAAAA